MMDDVIGYVAWISVFNKVMRDLRERSPWRGPIAYSNAVLYPVPLGGDWHVNGFTYDNDNRRHHGQ